MATAPVNETKWMAVANLKQGDTVKLTDGSIAVFTKMKQKNFSGTIDGKAYNIPINMFVEVLGKAVVDTGYKTLKPGEAFYIAKQGKAMLYTFMGMEGPRIVGMNPVSKQRTTIDISLYGGKVADL